jgi:hypothetical protein
MGRNRLRMEDLRFDQDGGKLFVDLPWEQADDWRYRVSSLGVGSTLYLDPVRRVARLYPWTNLSADALRELLSGGKLPAPAAAAG